MTQHPRLTACLTLALCLLPPALRAGEAAHALLNLEIADLVRHSEGSRESALRLLTDEFPDLALAHFQLGNLLARQKRWHEARASYQQALLAQNPPTATRFNLAISHERTGQRARAIAHYQAVCAASTEAVAPEMVATACQREQILRGVPQ